MAAEPTAHTAAETRDGAPERGAPGHRRLVPFERVVSDHGPGLWRFCLAEVGRDRAEDVFQETLLAALAAYPTLRDPGRVRAWLMTIATRKAVDAYRTRARDPLPTADPGAGLAGGGELATPDGELWGSVARLPPKQRQALALRIVADLAYQDVATAMGTTVEAARRNVFEALSRLRREAGPGGGAAATPGEDPCA